MEMIEIIIDGQKIRCEAGKTIGQVAFENKIFIPILCFHPDFPAKGNCRVCVVEIKGRRNLQTACSTIVEPGMEIFTDSPRVAKSRNLNIELLFAEHIEKCPDCVWRYNCPLLNMAKKYNIDIKRFSDRKAKRETYKFANTVEIDGSQCIDCRNCIDACSKMQKIGYLELVGKGAKQEVVPINEKEVDCIYCGQCALHCPVASAQEQTQMEEVEEKIKEYKKVVIAQFAPAIRVSIGEMFGLPYGQIATGQLVAGLKELGFKYVFDVNFAADMTTMVEAEELIERIKNKGVMPMMTSCCPAWVKYVEFYRPDLIPNLTTSRSPQIHGGGIIKTYWAKKLNIDPKNIIVVSVMPCTSKKYEATRKELKIDGNFPVDHVLTTRELGWMLKKRQINLAELKPQEADSPLAEYTGAAAVYGASGGVMESALRTAQYLLSQGNKDALSLCDQKLDFTDVRGLAGVKEATVEILGAKVRVVVVNGIGNIKPILNKLNSYDYIEVMACPGGCIGGGGQPVPTNQKIREARMAALYELDKSKPIRQAHKNESVKEAYDWLKKNKGLVHSVLHTSYRPSKKKLF